jgi:hypothetical protein
MLTKSIEYNKIHYMAQQKQIRINVNEDLEDVISHFRARYRLLSEADTIKAVLSEKYYEEMNRYDIKVGDNRNGIIQFLDEYHKTAPKIDKEEAERDIQEALLAVRAEK